MPSELVRLGELRFSEFLEAIQTKIMRATRWPDGPLAVERLIKRYLSSVFGCRLLIR